MFHLKNALSKIIHGDDNFCCLCFQTVVDEKSFGIIDKVFIDENENMQEVSVIMRYIFGEPASIATIKSSKNIFNLANSSNLFFSFFSS